MDIKQQIKEAAIMSGMDMCGVASVDRFATAPKGQHPRDVLPGCNSVIVVGLALINGAIQANFRSFEDGQHNLKGIYGTYGYAMIPNFHTAYACYNVARFVEKMTGEIATPCTTGPMTNGFNISCRHAAVAAGLGEFGWSGIVMSPEYGTRNRFGVILTTLELEPDPMYSGEKLCNNCGICTNICPVNALGEYGEPNPRVVEMSGKRFEYASFDHVKCLAVCYGMKKKGGREDVIETDDITPQDIQKAKAQMPLDDGGLQHYPTWHCGKCLSYCPKADWAGKFKKTGISGGAEAIKY